MDAHPPDPALVHVLPAAPQFVGRQPELDALRTIWRSGRCGVLGVVGLGGAGKTALVARFLDDLLRAHDLPKPDGLFVWSFYQEPDAGQFLQHAYRYFHQGDKPPTLGRGSGILHMLHEALAVGGPHLLVLDGLERMQRQESGAGFGQIEDPLLKGFLVRVAEGIGRSCALITSRFPLTDLAAFQGHSYRAIDLAGLDPGAANVLLRARGVQGDDATLAELVEAYGAHALTLDHLGGIIGQFLGGDARRAPEAPARSEPGSDRQALRLARLLRSYEEHLPAEELALLSRLCLFRRPLSVERIVELFLCNPAVHPRSARELSVQITHLPDSSKQALELNDLAEAVGRCLEEMLTVAPIAGPEAEFRHEVLAAAEKARELQEEASEADFTELARLYADAELDVQTDARPLPAKDREMLRQLSARCLELRSHALLPFKEKLDPALEQAFQSLGWKQPRRHREEDLRPDDLFHAYKRVRVRLWYLTCKHFLMRRVRELCGFYQRKWSLAGPLAYLDAPGLRHVLDTLVARHLAQHEADGSFSIHPAVRDYFHQRDISSRETDLHDLVRGQMVSLVQKPGLRLPEDTATLDMIEETIYHALQAGRVDEAEWLFNTVLGGMRHLAWKLGEAARGLRILRGFDPCPDRFALAWFLRALGEFDDAYQQNPMAYFRADVLLLQGRLPKVATEGDDGRSAIAAFLMGWTNDLPREVLGCAIPRLQLLLYAGHLDRVGYAANLAGIYQDFGWEGDRARCRLFQAELARRLGDPAGCHAALEAVAGWILHSGSVEHLCLMHLIQARFWRAAGNTADARREVEEGLHLARRCGLELLHIELLCEQAEIGLASADATGAETAARAARERALAPDCRFVWGTAEAGQLLGQALLARNEKTAACAILGETLVLRLRIGHPGASMTEQSLQRAGGQGPTHNKRR